MASCGVETTEESVTGKLCAVFVKAGLVTSGFQEFIERGQSFRSVGLVMKKDLP